ncbi:MAG: sigma-70 family RNA polymerase sigma factor [Lentisphaerae bacterium]|nr:sigma-70 family RNA polymerase sigma factor [Lentisphaerota bacterium]
MDMSDRELLDLYRAGDVDAMSRLIERHRHMLFGYIVNMTGNPAEADDVFQEVWFKVIHKLEAYRDGNFGGWLVRMARNLVIDRHRRRKPEISLDQEDEAGRGLAHTLAARNTPPSAALAAQDLGTRIAAAVAMLPEEQREVFIMRVQAELPFKEIARVQGVSINTALARMQYALTKLRPLLQDDYAALQPG